MSMYEVLSTWIELKRMKNEADGKGPPMTQERIEQLKNRWAKLGRKDIKV